MASAPPSTPPGPAVPIAPSVVASETKREKKAEGAVAPKAKAYKGFVAGVFSGVTKLCVGHPFDTLKVRLQTAPPTQFNGPIDCLLKTLRKEGIRGLYKGATPPLVGWMFMDSVMLGSMTNYRTLLRHYYYEPVHQYPSNKPLPHLGNAIAGLGGGWTVSFVAAPVEHIKARLQVQYHDPRRHGSSSVLTTTTNAPPAPQKLHGPITLLKHILTTHGIRGLYHGLLSTLLFRSHFFIFWGSYSNLTEYMRTHTSLSEPAINFWAGGVGAQCFWLTSYPFDVVKQRIMTDRIVAATTTTAERGLLQMLWTGKEGYAGGAKYQRSWWAAARGVYFEKEGGGGGLKGYWRGFTPCFLRAFPANAMALMTFEAIMRWLP